MPRTEKRAVALSLLFMAALTLWRVVFLRFNGTDLFVDEAQYWFWGQNLDFGYYSKPPMIGWLIRAVTDLAGSDAPFWVRMPAPILHFITGLMLMAVARRAFDTRVATWVGPLYVGLPVVTVGSFMISTDTVMLPFFGLALWMYLRLIDRPSRRDAVIMGAAVGLGLMSKYAAIYFGLGALLVALVQPGARIGARQAGLAALTALVVVAPNILWNITHDAATVRHTLDNADWRGDGLHWDKAAEFLGAQFGVAGPILFGALLWAVLRAVFGQLRGRALTLLLFSAPIVALVVGQALMSKAYANWAVSAYVAGTVLAVAMILPRRWPLVLSHAVQLPLALALPLLMIQPDTWRLPGGKPMFDRYLGRAEVSARVAEVATGEAVPTIVARDRNLLADLNYSLVGQGFAIYARTAPGFADSYYAQAFPVPQGFAQDMIYVDFQTAAPCEDAVPLDSWAPDRGAYAGSDIRVWRAPPGCLDMPGTSG